MQDITRRTFIKRLGIGGAVLASPSFVGCGSKHNDTLSTDDGPIPTDKMTMRVNPNTNDKVSILGYGCMRWPTTSGDSARESEEVIDQEQVNRLVDFAIEHGVNYFDTSPAYCKGKSEEATGIALARHDRKKLFIATKLSNFSAETWSHAKGVEMFENSLKMLQTDYIDYYLLHCIGQPNRNFYYYHYIYFYRYYYHHNNNNFYYYHYIHFDRYDYHHIYYYYIYFN